MITIKYTQTWEDSECRHTIRIKGHAEFAPKGQDIVCAGVSTLAYTLMSRLQTIGAWEYASKDQDGEMEISCISTAYDTDIEETIRFAMEGFNLMEEHYPKHVRVCKRV